MTRPTAEALLLDLSQRNVAVSLERGRLHVTAPKGVVTDELRQDLKHHKLEILAFLERKEKLLGMPLDEFARSRYRAELLVPGCSQSLWWVPTSLDVDSLMQQGIARGRIWTVAELQRLWDLGDLDQEQVQTLARIKMELCCVLQSIELPTVPEGPLGHGKTG